MMKLKNYKVVEMSENSGKMVNGGSWMGELTGKFLGLAMRYAGPCAAATLSVDMAIRHAKK
ncbi:MAG: hypothetical protein COA50_06200 [Flavobacteriaceae bacterium]|nr:MAG: hypothetical protein COA50_06200 [Flavobacteriaceae bacterium]